MASATPKQEKDEDKFNPDDVTSADNPQPTSLPEKPINVILTTVTKRDEETAETTDADKHSSSISSYCTEGTPHVTLITSSNL